MSKTMEWNLLKEKLYFVDGTLRDIIIEDMTWILWEKWIQYVNSKYSLQFKDFSNNINLNYIDINLIKECFDKTKSYYAVISIHNISVRTYFNCVNILEQDFYPQEVINEQKHNEFIKYIIDCSVLLDKKIIITPEMQDEDVLMSVYKKEIQYH
ncbi:MAG: hypothetical protein LBS50_11700 [Prevotellaceae bacterium]|nr:hypothetical protein [Prevotellaceae bacterium]